MMIRSDRSAVADLMRSPRFILGLAGCWDVSAVAEAMLPQPRKQWCARRWMSHVVRACSSFVGLGPSHVACQKHVRVARVVCACVGKDAESAQVPMVRVAHQFCSSSYLVPPFSVVVVG